MTSSRFSGHKHTPEAKRKISLSLMGNTYGSGGKGNPKSESHKKRIKESNLKTWGERKDELIRANREIRKKHDERLDERLAFLRQIGATIISTDHALIQEGIRPDILYIYEGTVIAEDVKATGEIINEGEWT